MHYTIIQILCSNMFTIKIIACWSGDIDRWSGLVRLSKTQDYRVLQGWVRDKIINVRIALCCLCALHLKIMQVLIFVRFWRSGFEGQKGFGFLRSGTVVTVSVYFGAWWYQIDIRETARTLTPSALVYVLNPKWLMHWLLLSNIFYTFGKLVCTNSSILVCTGKCPPCMQSLRICYCTEGRHWHP